MYTADSKLCTEANLSHIEFYGGQYITVMPRTWKEDALFRERVINNGVRWRLIMTRPNNRHPDTIVDKYYTTKAETTPENYRRIIWIRSTQKADVDRQDREAGIQSTIDELNILNSRINRYSLKRLRNIKAAIRDIIKKYNTGQFIQYSISHRTMVEKKYKTKGRPGDDTPATFRRWKEYRIIFEVNKDEVKRQSRADGVFPLLTNNHTKSAKTILTTYKYQSFLEKRHEQLKSWLEIVPVYLKKPKRVLALLDITVIALAVATLMERDLRRGMNKHHIASLPVYPEKRECKYPTTQSIIRTFSNIERYELYDDMGNIVEYFPPSLSQLQKQILNLMEVPTELFS
jgi:transposase